MTPNRSANSHQGIHEDCHGKFTVRWIDNGWYYLDAGIGVRTGQDGDDGKVPFNTSFEAYDAATGYGG